MEHRYFQEKYETMPRGEMTEQQSRKLVRQVKYVWDNVPCYRALMETKGVAPENIGGIEDLHKLPFISKEDLSAAAVSTVERLPRTVHRGEKMASAYLSPPGPRPSRPEMAQ